MTSFDLGEDALTRRRRRWRKNNTKKIQKKKKEKKKARKMVINVVLSVFIPLGMEVSKGADTTAGVNCS